MTLQRRTPLRRTSIRRVGPKALKDRREIRKVEEEVYARTGGRCAVNHCVNRATEIHHIQRRSQGGTNEPENLLAICRLCHRSIHDNPIWAKAWGYLK